jgi:hypothetical protein
MSYILACVQEYLNKSNKENVDMPDALIEEFGELAKAALRRKFKEPKQDKFTLRFSNVGRPLCQLQREAAGDKGSPPSYSDTFKMLLGDMTEALAVVIMKAAGVNVEATNERVGMKIGGIFLEGTYDAKIDGKIYDIKSASRWAFKHKFDSYKSLKDDDTFGYVAQGYGYAEAVGAKFGGWIAINKETGEWAVTETPEYNDSERQDALNLIDSNIRAIKSDKAFAKCFDDEPEYFRKKETGNRILDITCSFCPYKRMCWPEAVLKPQALSKAANPKMVWYTKYEEVKEDNGKEEGSSETGGRGETS